MPTASHIPIEKLVTMAEGWSLGKFGLLRANCFSHNGEYYDLPPERFAELHPDMPVTMIALASWMRQAAQMDAAKYQVKSTLDYLTNGIIEVVDGFDDVRTYLTIDKIAIYPAYPDQVFLSGQRAMLNEFEVNGIISKFVSETHVASAMPARAALEKQYPGWETRWLAGQALGLDNTELGRAVFTKLPYASMTVPLVNIEFD